MGRQITTVTISEVYKSFPEAGGKVKKVIQGVSLELDQHSFTSLVGPNGCGKSTLLNIIAGSLSADAGKIDYQNMQGSQPRVGYVWQDYRSSLLPWLTAVDNVAFPLQLKGISKEERVERGMEMMREYIPGVDPEKLTYQLSGGQQQLLCLLRSAISEPDILLFDEPFSALDQNKRWSMTTYVERIWQGIKTPALFVSHDVDEAVLISDKIVLMNKQGKIEEIIENPLSRPRSQHLLTDKQHVKCRDRIIDFLLTQDSSSKAINQ